MDDLKVEAKVLPALPQGLKAIPGVGVRRHHAPQIAALKMEGLMDGLGSLKVQRSNCSLICDQSGCSCCGLGAIPANLKQQLMALGIPRLSAAVPCCAMATETAPQPPTVHHFGRLRQSQAPADLSSCC